jgi:hypothetical protein
MNVTLFAATFICPALHCVTMYMQRYFATEVE